MSESWNGLNDDQRDVQRAINAIPRERRCASGWHVRPEWRDAYCVGVIATCPGTCGP